MTPYRATVIRGGLRPVIRVDRLRGRLPDLEAESCVADLEAGDKVIAVDQLDNRSDSWLVIGRYGALGEKLPLLPLR